MALNFNSTKQSIDKLRASKISLSTRIALSFGIIAAGAGYFAYTFYVNDQASQAQIKALNTKAGELTAKALQNADLEQKLGVAESAVGVLNAELAENKALLLQASEALEKCTPRLPKKGAISATPPASK